VGVERSVSFNFEEDTVIVGKLSFEGEWEHVERPPMQNMHPPASPRAPVPRATVEEIPDVEDHQPQNDVQVQLQNNFLGENFENPEPEEPEGKNLLM
jgi:hypothetical protein